MQIIHNPGLIPDNRYLASSNQSVIFEGSYSTYQLHNFSTTIPSFRVSSHSDKDSFAVIIHSLPANMSETEQSKLVEEFRDIAGNVFATGLDSNYYSSFWQGWEGFVKEMDN
jgi:hypothetical protein